MVGDVRSRVNDLRKVFGETFAEEMELVVVVVSDEGVHNFVRDNFVDFAAAEFVAIDENCVDGVAINAADGIGVIFAAVE